MESDKVDRILDAATALFARHGFRRASIDEVADLAGVGKGTVYLMCDSKADLFYQCVHRQLRDWVAAVSRQIDPRVPADQLLARCSAAAVLYLEDHPLAKELVLGHYFEVLPQWHEELTRLREYGRQNTVEIVRLGIEQGVFRADLDVTAVARVLQEMQAAGLILSWREKRPVADFVADSSVALDLLLKGLLAR